MAGIAKNAAKIAIRQVISKEVSKEKEKHAREELDLDDEGKEEEEELPMITMDMLVTALKQTRKSVSPQEYARFLEMKKHFIRTVCSKFEL